MKTDKTVEEIIRDERRKVFHALNVLPWGLLVLVLGATAFYFFRQSHSLNNIPATRAPVTAETNSITRTNFVTETKSVIVTNAITRTNFVTETKSVIVTNVVEVPQESIDVLWVRIEDAMKAKFEERETEFAKRDYQAALHKFRVEAVSNGYARWQVSIEGETSFIWKDQASSTQSMQRIVLPDRKYIFRPSDLDFARSISLDIEREIDRIVINAIEIHFFDRPLDQEFKNKLQTDLVRQIGSLFDGLETFRKPYTRR